MNKKTVLCVVLILLGFDLSAAVYKGHRTFVRKCVKCHTTGQTFVASKTIDQWEEYMEDKGKPLAELHIESDKAKASWKYFKSKRYTKKSKHLKQFLIEYAKDSGNVPACN